MMILLMVASMTMTSSQFWSFCYVYLTSMWSLGFNWLVLPSIVENECTKLLSTFVKKFHLLSYILKFWPWKAIALPNQRLRRLYLWDVRNVKNPVLPQLQWRLFFESINRQLFLKKSFEKKWLCCLKKYEEQQKI